MLKGVGACLPAGAISQGLSRLLVEQPAAPSLEAVDGAIRALIEQGVFDSGEMLVEPGSECLPDEPPGEPPEEEEPSGERERLTAKQLAAWRQHLLNAHTPYRKDCRACVLGASTGLQHRRVRQPHSFSLSYDVAGPFAEKGTGFKYAFIAGLRVPKDILPQAQDEYRLPLSGEPVLKEGGVEAEEEESLPYEPSEGEKALEPVPENEPLSECPSSDYGELADLADELIALANRVEENSPAPKVCKITGPLPDTQPLPPPLPPARRVVASFARFPMAELEAFMDAGVDPVDGVNRRDGWTAVVLPGADYRATDLSEMIPFAVYVDHKAAELCSPALQAWCHNNLIQHTTTNGTDPQSNGLAERLIGWFKSRTRVLLEGSGLSVQYWPLAMQYAEQFQHGQVFAREVPPMFGQKMLLKFKQSTNKPKQPFKRSEEGRYLTPFPSVSGGHLLLKDSTNGLVVSRSVRRVSELLDGKEEMDAHLPVGVAEDVMAPAEVVEKAVPPARRMREKGPPPDEEEGAVRAQLGQELLAEAAESEPTAAMMYQMLLPVVSVVRSRQGKRLWTSASLGAYTHGGFKG